MAKFVKIGQAPLFWPQCCALCMTKTELTEYERNTSLAAEKDYVVVKKITVRTYNNKYPICKKHHGQVRFNEIMLGVIKATLIGSLIISIVPIGAYLMIGKQGGYAMAAVALICLVYCLRRVIMNKVPIFVGEIGDDFVVLRFSSNQYAADFLSKNKETSKALRYVDL